MPKTISNKRPRVKKPSNDYFLKLQSPKWQKVRLQVFERAKWTCQACGETTKPLTVHHGLYLYGVEPWDLPDSTLWCLCTDCHSGEQDTMFDVKVELGRTNPAAYIDVYSAILKIQKQYAKKDIHRG